HRKGGSEDAYIMAIADRLDSADSAIVVGPEPAHIVPQQQQPPPPLAIEIPAAPDTPASDISEVASPLDSAGTCRVAPVSKKGEPDRSSFSSGENSMDDNVWFVPGLGESQAKLPVILVDGPYNAPMETFFEYHANIIVAAGIGITPYIAAMERVLDMCASNLPTRTTQTTSEDLLPQKIYLIWVFRDISLLCVMLPILQRLRANRRARDTVVPCLYVTGPIDVAHEGTSSDVFGRPMMRLSNGIRLSKGRPPVARMVSYMAGKHPNSRLGVFCCAPKKLTSQVRSSAHNANAAVAHQGTTMEMRSECFSV
ncbi:NADPH oxidase 4, partial [Coemansia spiralis]